MNVQDHIREQERLATARSNFEEQWQQISERIWPASADLFWLSGSTGRQRGQKNTELMLDAHAAIALERHAAILSSLMTPEAQKWHRLRTSSPELNRIEEVRLWYDHATDVLFRQRRSPKSGFYSNMLTGYMSIGAFGNGITFIDWENASPQGPGRLRYKHSHLSETYLKQNFQGVVDTVYRRFPMSHRQAQQMVAAGKFSKLPEKIDEMLKDPKQREQEFSYLHVVAPNDEFDGDRADFRGMPYRELYICVNTKEIVRESGYRTFPFAVGRPAVSPGESYGRGAGMLVLPNIKVLNEQKKTHLKMGHRLVDNVWLTHDDGVVDTFSLRPGAMNAGGVNAQGQKLVQPLYDNTGQLPQLKEMMDDEKSVIDDAFLVSLFEILIETPRMTATEVLERLKEKSILLSPGVSRLQSEMLGGMIERELDVGIRNGKIAPPPDILIEARDEFEVEYDSPLARVMRSEEAAGFARWMEQLLGAAQITQDPSPLDHVNWDVAAPELADIHAVPQRWLASAEEIGQKREGRQTQQAVQTAIEAGPSVAGLLKAGAGQ